MMMRIALVAFAAALALGVPGAGAQTAKKKPPKPSKPAKPREFVVVDRVVAVVNDSIILDSELRRRVEPLAAEFEGITDPRERARRIKMLETQILEEMIDEEIIVQAAQEAQLEVTEEEVDAAVEEIKRQNNVDDEGLERALRSQGYTLSAYRADVARQILRMRAINVLVRPRVNVTDDDVRAAYEERARRAGGVTAVKLHHILIAVPDKPSDAQLQQAKATAAEVVAKARAGTPFADLAAEYSDDPASNADGGDLGWFERGSLPTEWEVVIFVMDKGEVRGPVSGPRGLHVFYVADQKKAEQRPFEEVKEELHNDLYRRAMDKETDAWLEEMRGRSHIEIKL